MTKYTYCPVMGRLGALNDERGVATPLPEINRVLTRLGWRLDGGWLTQSPSILFR
mgnify:CR=1 FL=1